MTFADARAADRRVAGVPAAARIVRMLSDTGRAKAWLVLQDGAVPAPATMEEVERLRGAMAVAVISTGEADTLVRDGRDPAADRFAAAALLPGDAARAILKGLDKAGDGPVSRWINRPVSRRISALLLAIPGLRPVHATAGTALLAAAMFGALLFGGAFGLVLGGILFQAASVFDGVDGEVARATYRTSASGATLDSAVDLATNLLFMTGLTANLALREGPATAILGAAGIMLFGVGSLAIAWQSRHGAAGLSFDFLKHEYRGRFTAGLIPILVKAITVVMSRDFFALLFMALILLGYAKAVLYIFTGAAVLWIMLVAGAIAAAQLDERGARRRLPIPPCP